MNGMVSLCIAENVVEFRVKNTIGDTGARRVEIVRLVPKQHGGRTFDTSLVNKQIVDLTIEHTRCGQILKSLLTLSDRGEWDLVYYGRSLVYYRRGFVTTWTIRRSIGFFQFF
uniref:Uncharacterized protein n=1 Tax=Cacopsylla melanoneura TaxID=428564 RepID=A0A8D9B198_9HEMI